MVNSQTIRQFQRKVYSYYKKHTRLLPWRRTRNSYHILVSEIMLQQTQVSRVIKKYREFLARIGKYKSASADHCKAVNDSMLNSECSARNLKEKVPGEARFLVAFPTIESLARASLRDILKVWQGLGYNRRAFALKKIAERVIAHHNGKIPLKIETLKTLPGIGNATACAVCAFSFDQPVTFIETNIRSVFIHHFFEHRHTVRDTEILPLIEKTLDTENPRAWYYALMDYGVALKEKYANPARRSAHYKKQTPFEGSDRQIRGKILKVLVSHPRISEASLLKTVDSTIEKVNPTLFIKTNLISFIPAINLPR